MEVLRCILVKKKVLKAYHKTVDSARNGNGGGVCAAASIQILCVIGTKIV
jgi:hypothetical protein